MSNIRTCVIYVRISLASEESVAIESQIEDGENFAKAKGWKVVGVFRDEGVSATHNRPDQRKGWRALMASPQKFDAVVVWKVDRLARKVLDFLQTNEALEKRGAALVCVRQPIDMTTPEGRGFAQMQAVFGEMEAGATRDRVIKARRFLLKNGRHAGGRLPYGYRNAPNPAGPGYVVIQDEDAIEYVKEVVRRTQAGHTLYSTQRWLEEVRAPTPTMLLHRRRAEADGVEPPAELDVIRWGYGTVNKLVRHPMLAGMVPSNPGSYGTKERGDGLVRDENGMPVVYDNLAIMSQPEYRAMQDKLDDPIRPQRLPHAQRPKPSTHQLNHSGLLSGLVWCGEREIVKTDPKTGEVISRKPHPHPEPEIVGREPATRMRRGSTGNSKTKLRPSYYCPVCHQAITNGEDLIVREFISKRGHLYNLRYMEEVFDGGSIQFQEATLRLAELNQERTVARGARRAEIRAEIERLEEIQEAAEAMPTEVRIVPVGDEDRTFAQDWEAAKTDEERRDVIGHALDRVIVRRPPNRQTCGRLEANKLARLTFEWRDAGDVDTPPTDEQLARWAADRTCLRTA